MGVAGKMLAKVQVQIRKLLICTLLMASASRIKAHYIQIQPFHYFNLPSGCGDGGPGGGE